jgi:plasmid stabilization system protein ParE
MTLIVKSPVSDDLRKVALWISRDSPDAAVRFLTSAEETFELLRSQPGIGRLRSFSLPGGSLIRNYVVYYLPMKQEVQILAVLHGARDTEAGLAGRLD